MNERVHLASFDQAAYDVRFEWGLSGLRALALSSDLLIIVDVLSFSTSVDIVIGNGGTVLPYRGARESLAEFAAARGALYANPGRRPGAGFSLSPASLVDLPTGTRIVLPSPNGSTLSLAADGVPTMTGCLRNARSVAHKANQIGTRVSVIAAGERWRDNSLRPAIEDLLGAGAIIDHLSGRRSPEAEVALTAFRGAEPNLLEILLGCGSGKELIDRGFEEDVMLAGRLNVSGVAPWLDDAEYQG
jgi:2-phosphosulfolactate phosphatase